MFLTELRFSAVVRVMAEVCVHLVALAGLKLNRFNLSLHRELANNALRIIKGHKIRVRVEDIDMQFLLRVKLPQLYQTFF